MANSQATRPGEKELKPTAGQRPAVQQVSVRRLLSMQLGRHSGRYLEILRILRKYRLHQALGQLLMARAADVDGTGGPAEDMVEAHNLAAALEELGPCFIKLGQLMSTRPDLLPAPYVRALGRLQDRIKPVLAAAVTRTVKVELGAPIGELFQSFDCRPLATASMAVHRAVMFDGTAVAVKVQRPGVQRKIQADIEVLRRASEVLTRRTKLGARYGLTPAEVPPGSGPARREPGQSQRSGPPAVAGHDRRLVDCGRRVRRRGSHAQVTLNFR